ncbi:septum site-determining protein MinC [Agrilactobacillus yilanensis]|uniref:Septum site-determining protein MinC n=1 Tax=Agrilactobacillus yilanensis TaxID=2485997 RepID=A0ABW4J6A8_9LACO|nr:septum site-determining protein MinC [Agrilactobacillus yilanensis]
MDSVSLKGRKNGYEINLNANANFDDNITDLLNLLQRLSQSEQEDHGDLDFFLNTGRRLLDEPQIQRIQALFDKFQHFKLAHLAADVLDKSQAQTQVRKQGIHAEMSVIRSGQEVVYESDVLFLGNLHAGGVLKSTGSIFVLGQCEGILYAGYPDNDMAVIVGDISQATQVRISDTIEIIDPKRQHFSKDTIALINDLHVLDFDTSDHLLALRPKLYRKMEDNL